MVVYGDEMDMSRLRVPGQTYEIEIEMSFGVRAERKNTKKKPPTGKKKASPLSEGERVRIGWEGGREMYIPASRVERGAR